MSCLISTVSMGPLLAPRAPVGCMHACIDMHNRVNYVNFVQNLWANKIILKDWNMEIAEIQC